jgi:hypothetical protein
MLYGATFEMAICNHNLRDFVRYRIQKYEMMWQEKRHLYQIHTVRLITKCISTIDQFKAISMNTIYQKPGQT